MKRLLCVEDDNINAFILEKILSDVFDLTIVTDGESCLKLAQTECFDVVLMDINLGRGNQDGRAILLQLRELDTFKETPIFAITSYALPGDREQFLSSGFDNYFSKPLDKQLLLEAINNLSQ